MELGGNFLSGDLVDLLLVEKLERVAGPDLALEIDREAHDPHIFGKRIIGNVAVCRGAIDRIIDHALRKGQVPLDRPDGGERNPAFLGVVDGEDVPPVAGGEGKAPGGHAHIKSDRQRAKAGPAADSIHRRGDVCRLIAGTAQQLAEPFAIFECVKRVLAGFRAGLLEIHLGDGAGGTWQNGLRVGARDGK